MQAVQARAFGAPHVLEVISLPDPVPGPGEIAIDVSHAAVGLIDVLFRQGLFGSRPGMAQPPFVPGLEVAGTVRSLGDGVEGFRIGERVVSMSNGGTGGYASIFIAKAPLVVSLDKAKIEPALAVATIPNAAMAHVALSAVARLAEGESVLVHGALGGFSAVFSGIARQLGAAKVVGTVRASKLPAAGQSRLPYDRIVDSGDLLAALGGEKFDVIIDPVGGALRSQSLLLTKPGSRIIVVGNASGDWTHTISSNDLWLGSTTMSGFNAGAYLPTHPATVRPGLEAALRAVTAGLIDTRIDILPFSQAVIAHERMESRALDGRIVLTPDV